MVNWVALSVFIFFFLAVTVLGFVAARWRRGDLHDIDEWGLAGRRFGTLVTWFLSAGDLYTAYTFVAVPGPAMPPAHWFSPFPTPFSSIRSSLFSCRNSGPS